MRVWTGRDDDLLEAGTASERAAPALDPVAALLALLHRIGSRLRVG